MAIRAIHLGSYFGLMTIKSWERSGRNLKRKWSRIYSTYRPHRLDFHTLYLIIEYPFIPTISSEIYSASHVSVTHIISEASWLALTESSSTLLRIDWHWVVKYLEEIFSKLDYCSCVVSGLNYSYYVTEGHPMLRAIGLRVCFYFLKIVCLGSNYLFQRD